MGSWSNEELRRIEAADDSMADRIDEAYRSKYKSSPYLQAMIAQRSRAAAVRILPRSY
jgi:hypothetical protein